MNGRDEAVQEIRTAGLKPEPLGFEAEESQLKGIVVTKELIVDKLLR